MIFFLIGMMGSGKSTIARAVANDLKIDFLDIDDIIENYTQMSILNFFMEKGESEFRRLEHTILKNLINEQNGELKDIIIATGGGVVTNVENLVLMKKYGYVIFLDGDVNDMFKRIEGSNRPLLKTNSPYETYLDLKTKRHQLYVGTANEIIFNNDKLKSINDVIRVIKMNSNKY